LRGALIARYRQRANHWRWAVGIAAAFIASIGVHTFFAAGVPSNAQNAAAAPPVTVSYNDMRITLERRSAPQPHRAAPQAATADRQMVVVHNVVTLHQAPARTAPVAKAAPVVAAAGLQAQRAKDVAAAAATAVAKIASNPPALTQRDETSIAALKTAPTAAAPAARAESLAVFPNVSIIRDVVPVGGETAIVPRPAPIAYEEGAEGTTAFEVSVDDRGIPTKCTITKPSGYLVLDDAVCVAAMHAHYAPRTINGKPVPGVYRDAFTFRKDE
jgi:TonB family protein